MFQVFKEFRFEAAHTLDDPNDRDNRYSRLHGHSFRARVTVEGDQNAQGWVVDLGELEQRLTNVRENLDHHFLNEVDGLGNPTSNRDSVLRFVGSRGTVVANREGGMTLFLSGGFASDGDSDAFTRSSSRPPATGGAGASRSG